MQTGSSGNRAKAERKSYVCVCGETGDFMRKLRLKNRWVLVTGASSGLGREMAVQLAVREQANLILTARRPDRLEQLRAAIAQQATVSVELVPADLTVREDAGRVLDHCLDGRDLAGAVLNAGVTYFGHHIKMEWEQFEAILQTNVVSVVQMTNRLTAYFDEPGKEGGIMIVSSMAARWPVPYQAVYSGTKGFLLNFATALSQELENPDFSLTVFLPGGIATEMTGTDNFVSLQRYLMPVQQVAREGLSAFKKRRLTYIPGKINRLSSLFSPFVPSSLVLKQLKKIYGNALFKNDE